MFNINYDNLIISKKNNNEKNDFISINITGDWAPKLGNISDILIEKQEKYYGDLLPYFKNSDLNIVNLETVIDTKERDFVKGAVRLIDKPEVLNSLKSIDTHLVCMANNHIMDNGTKGLEETIYHLEQNNINYVGAGLNKKEIYKSFLYEKDGEKIAVINTAEGEESNEKYNNHCGASDIESYMIIDQIREAKKNGYFVILIAHAGVEFIPTPPPHIKELYKTFVDEGADLVAGHHPHVTQGFEVYKNSTIFYSLGNFGIYRKNSRYMETIGYLLNIIISKNSITTIRILPYKISSESINLLKGKELEYFKNNFKKSTKYINKNFLLNEIWCEYIHFRYIDLRLNEVVKLFKFNSEAFSVSQIGLVLQYSEKFMFLSKKDIKKFEYYNYLKEYGCIKKLKIVNRLFLLSKNKFSLLDQLVNLILKFLITSKRLFFKCIKK